MAASILSNDGKNSKVENPAIRYYTAAFLSDLAGETSTASYQLSLAEKSKSSAYVDKPKSI